MRGEVNVPLANAPAQPRPRTLNQQWYNYKTNRSTFTRVLNTDKSNTPGQYVSDDHEKGSYRSR